MSASTKKKIRKEQYLSERQRKEAEEQKKLKRYTRTFWIVMAVCLCIVLTTVLVNPVKNVIYRNKTAVVIGDHELSAVDVNYFYIDAINTYCNQYSYYISYIIDTKSPLNSASNTDQNGATWADKFFDMAVENIKSTYQLYDLAMKNGFQLPEDEVKNIDTMMSNLDIYAKYYGYKNADAYLNSMYGNGANTETYRAYYEVCAVADAYYTEYAEGLEYDDAALRAYEADKHYQYSSYTYAYYYFNASTFLKGGTKGEDGKITYSDDEKAAAVEIAKQLAEDLLDGSYEDLDAFDKAINTLLTEYYAKDKVNTENNDVNQNESKTGTTEDNTTGDNTTGDNTTGDNTTGDNTTGDNTTGDNTTGDNTTDEDKKEEEKLKYTSTKEEDILYTQLRALFADWLRGKEASEDEGEDEDKEETLVVRKEGDLTLIVNESGTGDNKTINGFYVLRFGSVNENTFMLKNVRHILVAFEGGKTDANGNKTYTEAEKNKARDEAKKLYEEFKNSDMTEETFAKMANEHSDDGDGTTGGLYEDIFPGQMVEAFDKWCYDAERKPGDSDMVQTEYGWHIMYFVGDSESNYRDYMVENDLRAEELKTWMEELVKAAVIDIKTQKYVNKELVLSAT